jgi:tRNA dimethylallyltransferase
MQVYRGLDIGTAKPTHEERQRVRHHLIDVVDLSESFDAAKFVRLAGQAVADVRARGHLPILCGGTGFYFHALIEGLSDVPPADATLRNELAATPMTELLGELAVRDPLAYEKIDRQNPRRIIRAIEVIRLTGEPYSHLRTDWNQKAEKQSAAPLSFGFSRPVADLRRRIDLRVETMFQRGITLETQNLLREGLAGNKTALQALGYRQVAEYLRGERSLADTIELLKIRTRQFAKRQMTWFRKQMQLKWLELGNNEPSKAVIEHLAGAVACQKGD